MMKSIVFALCAVFISTAIYAQTSTGPIPAGAKDDPFGHTKSETSTSNQKGGGTASSANGETDTSGVSRGQTDNGSATSGVSDVNGEKSPKASPPK